MQVLSVQHDCQFPGWFCVVQMEYTRQFLLHWFEMPTETVLFHAFHVSWQSVLQFCKCFSLVARQISSAQMIFLHLVKNKNRLPRCILYGELVSGQRLPGGPKLRYMDHIRHILNKCNISTAELEQLSTDRDTWKSACASALATYNVSADQAAEDRCIRRHNPANPPTTGPRCPQCSRICASEFGLRSHQRSHASRPHQQHSQQHKRHCRTRRTTASKQTTIINAA